MEKKKTDKKKADKPLEDKKKPEEKPAIVTTSEKALDEKPEAMSPLAVTPSVVTILQESIAQRSKPSTPAAASVSVNPPKTPKTPNAPKTPKTPNVTAKAKEGKNPSRSNLPAAQTKPKTKYSMSHNTSGNTSRSTSRNTVLSKASTDPFNGYTPLHPPVRPEPEPGYNPQQRDGNVLRGQNTFQQEFNTCDTPPATSDRSWNNRGYGYNSFMNDSYYDGSFTGSMQYPLNYSSSMMHRKAVEYTPRSLLNRMDYTGLSGFDEYNAFSDYSGMISTDTMGGLGRSSGLNDATQSMGFNGPMDPNDPSGSYGGRDSRGYVPMGYDMYNDRSSAWLSVGAGLDDALNDSLYSDQLLNYDRRNDQMMEEREDVPSNVRDLNAVVFPSSRSGSVTQATSRLSEGLSSGTPAFGT